MAEFTVTSKALKGRADMLEGYNKTLMSKILSLEAEEAALSSMWEGESHDAFDRSFKENKGKMILFHDEIVKYVNTLRTAAAKYEAAEKKNVMTASGR